MGVLLFHDVDVDRTVPMRAAVVRLREAGFAVTGDYDEEFRLLKDEADAAPAVKLALASLPEPLNTTDAFERYARDNGVRLATLREAAALAEARPDLFARKSDAIGNYWGPVRFPVVQL